MIEIIKHALSDSLLNVRYLLETALPVLLTAMIVSAAIAAALTLLKLFSKSDQKSRARLFGALFIQLVAVGLIAFLAGFISGNTRETVVGDVLPVLLSGLGALFGYAYIQGKLDKILTSALGLSFTLCLFLGLIIASGHRDCRERAKDRMADEVGLSFHNQCPSYMLAMYGGFAPVAYTPPILDLLDPLNLLNLRKGQV